MKVKELLKVTGLPVAFASLCCLSPLILVMFGLGTTAFAASLADTLYYGYAWAFRIAGLLLLTISLFFYLRRAKGICSVDDVIKRRNEVINIVAITLITAVIGYVLFLYVGVHYVGVWYNIWQ